MVSIYTPELFSKINIQVCIWGGGGGGAFSPRCVNLAPPPLKITKLVNIIPNRT